MKKLTGNINVGVFISGRGSNLKELIKYSKKKNTKWKIKLVISNKKEAKGLAYAKKNKKSYQYSFFQMEHCRHLAYFFDCRPFHCNSW